LVLVEQMPQTALTLFLEVLPLLLEVEAEADLPMTHQAVDLVVVVMEKIQTQELLEPRIKVLLVVVQFLQTELLLVVVVLAQ
jgi:hypothetical protein